MELLWNKQFPLHFVDDRRFKLEQILQKKYTLKPAEYTLAHLNVMYTFQIKIQAAVE